MNDITSINTDVDFENMSDDELKEFRAQFDADSMGFNGAEGAEEGDDNASN